MYRRVLGVRWINRRATQRQAERLLAEFEADPTHIDEHDSWFDLNLWLDIHDLFDE